MINFWQIILHLESKMLEPDHVIVSRNVGVLSYMLFWLTVVPTLASDSSYCSKVLVVTLFPISTVLPVSRILFYTHQATWTLKLNCWDVTTDGFSWTSFNDSAAVSKLCESKGEDISSRSRKRHHQHFSSKLHYHLQYCYWLAFLKFVWFNF